MSLLNKYKKIQEELNIVGQSEQIRELIELIISIAPTNISVLISGESGTGKEVFAKAIHQLSPRKDKTMISVNCGAIPEGLLESELFGHERGAFTGAVATKKGYFELADGGTILLDEIG
ncbi:MAG: sigma-54 factor interaction domain-containing protein, partial [Calditrichaeota bacterium]|nr:sigma-54 factor interaction domain-containing protein [Calditrichota bacterium]MCB0316823.1 sigma-54 factor interaction domain-containing protein [Calditrichota bacterium]